MKLKTNHVIACDPVTLEVLQVFSYPAQAAKALGVSRQAVSSAIVHAWLCRGLRLMYKAEYEALNA